MFRIGPVHIRDNGPGVSGAESEHTGRYLDLLYAQTRVGYRRSRRNRFRACAYPTGINMRSRGVSIPTESLVAARWSLKYVATCDTIWPP